MIKANIYDKKLTVDNFTISDSVKFDTVVFTFPNDWKNYTKTVVFKTSSGDTINVILDKTNPLCINENECYIPHEALKPPHFYLSVFGILGESVATTTQVKVNVLQSGYAEGTDAKEPTPTEYQQLVELATQTKEIAQSVRADADNGVFNGKNGIDGYTPLKGVDYFTEEDITALNIPLVDENYDCDSDNPQSGKAVAEAVNEATDSFYIEDTYYGYNIVAGLDITSIYESNSAVQNFDGEGGYDFQRAYLTYNNIAIKGSSDVSTKFVYCMGNVPYRYHGYMSGNSSICFYDIEKRFISGINANTIGAKTDFVITTPSNCAYMKFTVHKNYLNSFRVLYEGDLQKKTEECTFENIDDKKIMLFDKEIGNELYVHMKVRFPEDVHNVNENLKFFRIWDKKSRNADMHIELQKAKTALNNTVFPLAPVPVYNAGIRTYTNGMSPTRQCLLQGDGWRKNFLIGEDTMSIRFIGDCTDANNQNLYLKITDTMVQIYRYDGVNTIGVANWQFSNYPTMSDLYNAMLADTTTGHLAGKFEVDFLNLKSYTPYDLIPGTVHLVAPYKKETGGEPVEYRAYPCYFTAKEKGKVYDVEISLKKDAEWSGQVIIDGYGIIFPYKDTINKIFNNECLIAVGDSGVSENGVDILSVEIKDRADYKYPNLRVFYAEVVNKGTQQATGYYTSEITLSEVETRMKKENFGYIKMDNILESLRGNKSNSGERLYHFAHDDGYKPQYLDQHLQSSYLRNDIIPSCGLIMNSETDLTQEAIRKIKALRKIGYVFYPHTPYSDNTEIDTMLNLSLFNYEELATLVDATIARFIEEFEDYPVVWDFHAAGGSYNEVRFLINKGFQLIFGGNGNGLLSPINRYWCTRAQINDAKGINDRIVYDILNSYYNYVHGQD